MTNIQAAQFVATWYVVTQYTDPATGLSATIFQRKDANGQPTSPSYLAIQGTAGILDYVADYFILNGTPSQINPQYQALRAKVAEWIDNGTLGGSVTVTGHSLGGWLAASLVADFGASFSHAYLYNAPGNSSPVDQILQALGITDASASSRITSLRADAGLSPIAGLGHDFAPPLHIAIENQLDPDVADRPLALNHSQRVLTDALAVYAAYAQAAPNLGVDAITSILRASANDDASTLETALDNLRTLIEGPNAEGTVPENRESLYAHLQQLQTALASQPARGIVALTGLTRDQIAGLARTDIAYRYALEQLNPFAVTGDASLYDQHNTDGHLNADQSSDLYLKDRAALLSWKMQYDLGNLDADDWITRSAGTEKPYEDDWNSWSIAGDWRFTDLSRTVAGQPLSIFVDGVDLTTSADHLIVFGGAGNENLLGGSLADHLYGGAGGDTFTGGQGDDWLEGGVGTDTYVYTSGAGRDTILDTDGQGVIKWGGQTVKGSGELQPDEWLQVNTNTWRDTRNGYYYGLMPGTGGDILTITQGTNTLTIRDWEENELGIALGAGQAPSYLTITGTDLADSLGGTPGNDRLLGLDGNDSLDATQGGNDSLGTTQGGSDSLGATQSGSDQLEGGLDDDLLSAGVGDDQLIGNSGQDILLGGNGRDALYGGDMVDDLAEAILAGEAQLGTGDRGDLLDGGNGVDDDILVGDSGNDFLLGGGGTDLILGGGGDDTIDSDRYSLTTSRNWALTRTMTALGDRTRYEYSLADMYIATSVNGGPDVIYAGGGADWIWSGTGGDNVIAGEGADVVFGGEHDDVLMGGAGNDQMEGDEGFQNTATGNDVLLGEAGDDRLWGGAGDDSLEGGDGDDRLMGDNASLGAEYAGEDTLYGGANNDKLWGDGRGDVLFGGTGNDELQGDNNGLAAGLHGDDWLEGEVGNDTLLGQGGTDTMYGGANDDIMAGGAGADMLYGGQDNDIMQGDGLDVPTEAHGGDYLDGGDGVDVMYGLGGSDTLYGGAGNDQLQGDAVGYESVFVGNDSLYGEAGDDTLYGQNGDDRLYGGEDNDRLFGGAGQDTLDGGAGNDRIAGDYGGTRADGEADSIDAGAGDDVVDAQGGDDSVSGGAGKDLALGGAGNDTLSGGAGNDQLQGGANDDTLDGGADSDTLFGEAGSDTLDGGDGTDYLLGGTGDDVIEGGLGDDVYYYALGDGQDRYSDRGGSDWLVLTGITLDQIVLNVGSLKLELPDGGAIHLDDFDPDHPYAAGGIEYIQFADGQILSRGQLIDLLGIRPTGTEGDDLLGGTALSETITALAGNDTVDARAGDDTVYGGTEDDVLLGGAGADVLHGEAGNDRLDGGAGSDQLLGGEGDDTYVFRAGDGQDTVIDSAGLNGIVLTGGATLADTAFARAGNDLLVTLGGGADRLTVRDWFVADSHFLGVAFDDGSRLDRAGVEANLARNQTPVAVDDLADVGEDAVLSAGGNVLANDSDPEGRTLIVTDPGSRAGAYGTFILQGDGGYAYSLDNALAQGLSAGQVVTEEFGYSVSDNDPAGAATATARVVVRVTGQNDAPGVAADLAEVAEDGPTAVSGNVLANDLDRDAADHLAVANPGLVAGRYGGLELRADGGFDYRLANDSPEVQALGRSQRVEDSFEFIVGDGLADVPGSLTVAIAGRNDAPVFLAPLADQSAAPNRAWSWQIPAGSVVDIDQGDVLQWRATLTDGSALPIWLSFDAATLTFSGRVPRTATGSLGITLTVTDGAPGADPLGNLSVADSFEVYFDGSTHGGNPGDHDHGNEGLGNGEDPPPAGHDDNFNDGPGTGPGNPGARGAGLGGWAHPVTIRQPAIGFYNFRYIYPHVPNGQNAPYSMGRVWHGERRSTALVCGRFHLAGRRPVQPVPPARPAVRSGQMGFGL